jgi:glutamine synthetase
MAGVDDYVDLLRLSVASASNDHRLGGNEAPPAIVSIFLGDRITKILENFSTHKQQKNVVNKQIASGVKFINDIESDNSDRNRTSPFAFTGAKFEFRMPGSSLNIACVNFVLNTIVAEAIDETIKLLGKNPGEEKIKSIIATIYKKHKRILFGGNGYSEEWKKESAKRGLLNLTNTPDAIALYDLPKNISLFEKYHVLNQREIKARQNILFEEYNKHIKIESLTMLDMVNRQIIPCVINFQSKLSKLILNKKSLKIKANVEIDLLSKIVDMLNELENKKNKLVNDLAKLREIKDIQLRSKFYATHIVIDMESLREIVDKLERIIPKNYWPMPTYADILFY